MKLQEYLWLRSDPGVLDYISVYAKYSGEQLRTIGPLVLHIHIEILKKDSCEESAVRFQNNLATAFFELIFVGLLKTYFIWALMSIMAHGPIVLF